MNNHTGYLKITNKGEMDIGALTMIGATNKRGDSSKIGFFGSGLKYSMAVMLRAGIPFKIFSGEKEYKIGTKKKKFRGNEINLITVNGKDTSFTTDMGANWKPWFCIRELYCNALDEGNTTIEVAGETSGSKGSTAIYIGFTPEIKRVVDNWNNYFSNKRTDVFLNTPSIRVYSGGSKMITYRKGINVFEQETKCLFNYDLDELNINESRVVDSPYMMNYYITSELKNHATVEIARAILENGNDDKLYETINLNWQAGYTFNQNWLEAIGDRKLVPREVAGLYVDELTGNELLISNELIGELKKFFQDKIKIIGRHENGTTYHKKTEKEQQRIDKCVDILRKVNLEIPYKIEVVSFEQENVLGSVNKLRDEILIARKTLNMGKRMLLSTIIEEYSHLDSEAGDKTRKFQDYLINQYINQIEQQIGEEI